MGWPWAPLITSVLLGACAIAPTKTTPAATPPVRTPTTMPTPVQPTAVEPGAGAMSVQRPAVDLRPPSPTPFLSLIRQDGGDGPSPDYLVELNEDGTGRFIGHSDVCVKGEVPFQVSNATVEEAKRIVRASHVFDHPLPPCSHCCVTDVPPVAIYFWESPPGRTVGDADCPAERRPVWRLAAALDELLDVKRWVRKWCPL